MRISSVNFGLNKSVFLQKNKMDFLKPILVYGVDKVSFTSKTQEQKVLAQEAKTLSKEAYTIFARGKKIQKQTFNITDNSAQIISKAYRFQREAQDEWFDLQNALEYAKEFGVKAYADPVKDTQIIFDISNKKNMALMVEYKDGKEIKKVDKKPDYTILTKNNGFGRTARMLFDTKTGSLLQVDEGFEQVSPTNSYSDASFVYEDNQLKDYFVAVSRNPKTTNAKKKYSFSNGYLDAFVINSHVGRNGFLSSEEEYWLENDAISHYFKNKQAKEGEYLFCEEEYSFNDKEVKYIKNKNKFFGEMSTADKVFCYSDSKIQKAIIGMSADSDTRMVEKYFVYDEKERPQACYLNHQTTGDYEFDFKSNSRPYYEKLVWLN